MLPILFFAPRHGAFTTDYVIDSGLLDAEHVGLVESSGGKKSTAAFEAKLGVPASS